MSGMISLTFAQSLTDATEFLLKNDDFLVVSHLSPDGDAISSTAAIGFILQALGKKFILLNEGRIPEKYKSLLDEQEIINFSKQKLQMRYSCAILLDCADFSRIGEVKHALSDDAVILNIDHHSTNESYGTWNLLKTDAAATVEIIYELADKLKMTWSKPLANCIYAGLLTDTGGFRYANTTPKVLRIAEHMLREGADGPKLAQQLLEMMSYQQVQLWKEVLTTLSFSNDLRVAWIVVSAEMAQRIGSMDEDTEGLVNIPRNVAGVEVGILFKEIATHEIKVSLRSTGTVNVAQLAKHYGGGGHVLASGCTLRCSLGEAIDHVLETVTDQI